MKTKIGIIIIAVSLGIAIVLATDKPEVQPCSNELTTQKNGFYITSKYTTWHKVLPTASTWPQVRSNVLIQTFGAIADNNLQRVHGYFINIPVEYRDTRFLKGWECRKLRGNITITHLGDSVDVIISDIIIDENKNYPVGHGKLYRPQDLSQQNSMRILEYTFASYLYNLLN